MDQDRRKSVRVVVDVPARITVNDETIDGRLRDICRDAALVEAERAYPLETAVTIEAELPRVTGAIRASGRVIRLAPGKESGSGMAILFDGLSSESALRIDLFTSEQEI